MAKKDFKNSPAMNFITDPRKIDECDEHNVYEEHEEREVETTNKTQGRKGQKLPRLNMAFYNNNLDYVQKIAGVKGMSATAYVNHLIDEDRKKNEEVYEKIKNINSEF